MSSEHSIAAGLAGRYATALFELAESDGALDQVAGELDQIQRLADASEDLRRLIRSPVFSSDEQGRAMRAVLERAGISGLTAKFVGLVVANRRLFAVLDMIAAYRQLLAAKRGEITANVVSASALTDAQIGAIKSTLAQAMGRDVHLNTQVDANLLGGLIVKVGSRMIDSSLRTKLQNLKFAMKEAS